MERIRAKDVQKNSDKIADILKTLLVSYIITGGLLLLLSLLLYKFSLAESIVSISIIVIYVLASFVAGNLAGKRMESRRFLWGLVMGVLYFLVLAIVSLIVNHSLKDVARNFFTVLVLCAAGGMLGGIKTNLK